MTGCWETAYLKSGVAPEREEVMKDVRVSVGEYMEGRGVEGLWEHQGQVAHSKGHSASCLSWALQGLEAALLSCCAKTQSPDALQ